MTHPFPSKKGGDYWNLFSDLETGNIYLLL
jgi:hypothetical protein